jgi:Arc/MetJ-type ribon-helix-helix transcriptional regulator
MATTKIAISMDAETVRRVDDLVANARYPSRSRVIQDAVQDKLARLSRSRLAEQCSLLDASAEQEMAEEFTSDELEAWQQA